MRAKITLLTTVAGASSLLLAGCCAPHHLTKWEYKEALLSTSSSIPQYGEWLETRQRFLNQLGKDGWILVDEPQPNVFNLKRQLR